MADTPTVIPGALILALMSLPPDEEEAVQPTGTETLFILDDELPEDQIDKAAEIVRRCPMAKYGTAQTAENQIVSLLLARDDLERGSGLSGLIAGAQTVRSPALVRYNTKAGSVFLPRNRIFSRETLRQLGDILEAVSPEPADASDDSASETVLAAYRDQEGCWNTLRCELPTADAEALFEEGGGGTGSESAAEWRFKDLRETEASLKALRETISRLAPRAGYRLTLHPYAPPEGKGQSLARILERIAELEIKASFLRGVEAPHTTLLRFTQAQLPALADFIESVPIADIDSGRVQYAFYASAGEPDGIHFLMYDPALVLTTRPFSEWSWRRDTEDAPIRYWVDPNWTQFYGRVSGGVKSKVFTPHNAVLHPTLHSYAPEDMDAYLRDIVARRLSSGEQNDAVRALLDDSRRAPGLVFTHSTETGFDIEIDVIDLDAFLPLRQRLDWINDNLLMNDPALVDQERMRQIAQSLYEGAAAQALLDEMGAQEEKAGKEAEAMIGRLSAKLDGLTGRFRAEFQASVEQAELMTGRIQTVAQRIAAIEAMLAEAEDLNAEAQIYTEGLAPIVADLEGYREEIEARLREALAEAETFVSSASVRLAMALQSIDTLSAELRRERGDA
jgi:chaperonin cofactor prefoldin